MDANSADRIGGSREIERTSIFVWLLSAIGVFTFAAILIATISGNLSLALRAFQPVANKTDRYSVLYERWRIAPIPYGATMSTRIWNGLQALLEEPCNKHAIFEVGEALNEQGHARIAADVYLGFANSCSNGEGDRRRAADILLNAGEYERARSIASDLVSLHPESSLYHYLRGKIELSANLPAQALSDYVASIRLSDDQSKLGDWVFTEMAQAYAYLGRYCDAMAPIKSYIAFDPAKRSLPRFNELIRSYSAQGQCT